MESDYQASSLLVFSKRAIITKRFVEMYNAQYENRMNINLNKLYAKINWLQRRCIQIMIFMMNWNRKGTKIYLIFVAVLSSNITSEYQEESAPEDTNPLSNTWLKAEDTRRYAEKLTKYSSKNRIKENLLEPVVCDTNILRLCTVALN